MTILLHPSDIVCEDVPDGDADELLRARIRMDCHEAKTSKHFFVIFDGIFPECFVELPEMYISPRAVFDACVADRWRQSCPRSALFDHQNPIDIPGLERLRIFPQMWTQSLVDDLVNEFRRVIGVRVHSGELVRMQKMMYFQKVGCSSGDAENEKEGETPSHRLFSFIRMRFFSLDDLNKFAHRINSLSELGSNPDEPFFCVKISDVEAAAKATAAKHPNSNWKRFESSGGPRGIFFGNSFGRLPLSVWEAEIDPTIKFMERPKLSFSGWFLLDTTSARGSSSRGVSVKQIHAKGNASPTISISRSRGFEDTDDDFSSVLRPLSLEEALKVPPTKPKVLSFDIEVYSDNPNMFPDPCRSGCCVFMISCVFQVGGDKSTRARVLIYLRGVLVSEQILNSQRAGADAIRLVCVSEEKGMLDAFADIVQEFDPDVITGYNISGFDWKYLDKRNRLLNHTDLWPQRFSRSADQKLNPVTIMYPKDYSDDPAESRKLKAAARAGGGGGQHANKADDFTPTICGRILVDMIHIVKEYKMSKYDLSSATRFFFGASADAKMDVSAKEMFAMFKESMTVSGEIFREMTSSGAASNTVGGEMLLSFETSSDDLAARRNAVVRSATRVAEYAVRDSELVIDLFNKIEVWAGLVEMSSVCGIPMSKVQTTGQQKKVVSALFKEARRRNVVMDRRDFRYARKWTDRGGLGRGGQCFTAAAKELDGGDPSDENGSGGVGVSVPTIGQGGLGSGSGVLENTDGIVPYEGGAVQKPIQGLHERVITVDFSGLYPSIIIAFNICFSTFLCDFSYLETKAFSGKVARYDSAWNRAVIEAVTSSATISKDAAFRLFVVGVVNPYRHRQRSKYFFPVEPLPAASLDDEAVTSSHSSFHKLVNLVEFYEDDASHVAAAAVAKKACRAKKVSVGVKHRPLPQNSRILAANTKLTFLPSSNKKRSRNDTDHDDDDDDDDENENENDDVSGGGASPKSPPLEVDDEQEDQNIDDKTFIPASSIDADTGRNTAAEEWARICNISIMKTDREREWEQVIEAAEAIPYFVNPPAYHPTKTTAKAPFLLEEPAPDSGKVLYSFAFVRTEVKEGLLPALLKGVLRARKAAQDQLKETKAKLNLSPPSAEECETLQTMCVVLNARQLALKRFANSVYGFLGVQRFGKFPCIELAKCVTALGRKLIGRVNTFVKKDLDGRVVYGDTDSSMFQRPKHIFSNADCISQGHVLTAQLNTLFPPPIALEFEKAMIMVSFQKKQYAALVIKDDGTYDHEHPIVRGIVCARRDNSKVHRDLAMKVIMAALHGKKFLDAIKIFVDEMEKVFQLRTIGDAISALEVVKSIGFSYATESAQMDVFSEVCAAFGRPVAPGERIGYMVVKESVINVDFCRKFICFLQQRIPRMTHHEIAELFDFSVENILFAATAIFTAITTVLFSLGDGDAEASSCEMSEEMSELFADLKETLSEMSVLRILSIKRFKRVSPPPTLSSDAHVSASGKKKKNAGGGVAFSSCLGVDVNAKGYRMFSSDFLAQQQSFGDELDFCVFEDDDTNRIRIDNSIDILQSIDLLQNTVDTYFKVSFKTETHRLKHHSFEGIAPSTLPGGSLQSSFDVGQPVKLLLGAIALRKAGLVNSRRKVSENILHNIRDTFGREAKRRRILDGSALCNSAANISSTTTTSHAAAASVEASTSSTLPKKQGSIVRFFRKTTTRNVPSEDVEAVSHRDRIRSALCPKEIIERVVFGFLCVDEEEAEVEGTPRRKKRFALKSSRLSRAELLDVLDTVFSQVFAISSFIPPTNCVELQHLESGSS